MEEKKLFHDRYFMERLLGRGNFSEVWLARDTKTDIAVALKIYAPATGLDDNGLNVFAREFALVVNANHKNLLKPLYYDNFERKPYLVLPYCKDGSIMRNVGKFTEEEAWRLIRDVASGLSWLHNMNPPVIHQDIKPDNVMIGENGDFMITDFGVSTHLKSTLRKSMSAAFSSAGTIAYMAPERFGKDNTPIMANDIYSLGATVFEMLTGDTPFGNDGGLVQKKGADVPELKGEYSSQLKKVISKCLRTNAWERPTAEQLEKYAETALKGEVIRFIDEKTFVQKNKYLIILSIIVIMIGCIGSAIFISNQKVQKLEYEKMKLQVQRNDSIRQVIAQYCSNVKRLEKKGDNHEEQYEQSYIEAYETISKAIEAHKNLSEDKGNRMKAELTKTKVQIEKKLREAFSDLNEKAKLFEADDPEVYEEFRQRAQKVKSSLCINNK
ncbi:serine/threonine protein kinase [Leyella stercorea]|jgi:serine/threonine protein kinase|uniref:serine/threonine protein kinase n=1 Tax=Leyella stercorea TaxID=363265 RepID=UPI00266D8A12|nr:serine/threonine-protein kinase [Leyella stercorea]